MTVGYALGGGGVRGAVEVGMLRALFEVGITPDLVVGTSIGAINGAALAANPTPSVVDDLEKAWSSEPARAIYGESWVKQMSRLARSGTHLSTSKPLRAMVNGIIGEGARFEDLPVPLAVCAASIERAAEQWFDSGLIIDAVLASSAVPAALPPVVIDGEHYVDGGVVNSIPVGEAIHRGATEVFVLQVGRVEEPLEPPKSPTDVGRVTFEIARRHRFARDMAQVPEGVSVHILPYGGHQPGDKKLGAYRNMDLTKPRMDAAYRASLEYLAEHGVSR
ncbi:patatin-like phospholipase family protein [Demequina sediminicola]|uniref:patatin-like phospholipase family protein n=1 Tax=Demequina sediminicola TaxID=1095026 RepID=UPI000780E090|nr:patatin-like phospholipase family protein [Demequina sediminicola]